MERPCNKIYDYYNYRTVFGTSSNISKYSGINGCVGYNDRDCVINNNNKNKILYDSQRTYYEEEERNFHYNI